MPGWQSGVTGWSIWPNGSGAPIELDEPLDECRVGVFSVSFQLLLWGVAKKLPDIWLFPIGMPTSRLVPIEPERWLLVEREDLSRVAMGGNVRLRIDQSPIRFGNFILECLKSTESSEGCCAFCNEPLRRISAWEVSRPVQRAEKFKQERAPILPKLLARPGNGIAVAIAGGDSRDTSYSLSLVVRIHPHWSFVGITIRISSRNPRESGTD
jgi:hypothetical protein